MTTKRELRARLRGKQRQSGRFEGPDIFERRAVKDAIRSLDTGSSISPGTQKALKRAGFGEVTNPGRFGQTSGFVDPDSVFSQVGVVTPLDRPGRGQALFGARQAVRFNNPFSDFQRRELGITDENEGRFRSAIADKIKNRR